tara:strand:+ start:1467 stop:3008 length:1542 start_codon:yes stop_codon:yes gene_type:complete
MMLDSVLQKELLSNIQKSKFFFGTYGFEREFLRTSDYNISQSKHPKKLGSALCNKFITNDFSSSQLELVTPPIKTPLEAFEFLKELHLFVYSNLSEDEELWPLSIPPYFKSDDEIKIADFGKSTLGRFKKIYRNGLDRRYGRVMQSISGFHYNYSLNKLLTSHSHFDDSSRISEAYFAMLRNITRYNWLLIYLFGASPVISKHFIFDRKDEFLRLDDDFYLAPDATSLRMSDFGYQNTQRVNFNASLDSLNSYLDDLQYATSTNKREFQFPNLNSNGEATQLNSNLLQIDAEYYSIVRPKSSIGTNKHSMIKKLRDGGVDYIELRSLDINPFSSLGIDLETIHFIEVFMIFCLLSKDQLLSASEIDQIKKNELSVAKEGRKKDLLIQENTKTISLIDAGLNIIEQMLVISKAIDGDSEDYTNSVISMRKRLHSPSKTLSGSLIRGLEKNNFSFMELGKAISQKHESEMQELKKLNTKHFTLFNEEVKSSLKDQILLEQDDQTLDHFIEEYFSS